MDDKERIGFLGPILVELSDLESEDKKLRAALKVMSDDWNELGRHIEGNSGWFLTAKEAVAKVSKERIIETAEALLKLSKRRSELEKLRDGMNGK